VPWPGQPGAAESAQAELKEKRRLCREQRVREARKKSLEVKQKEVLSCDSLLPAMCFDIYRHRQEQQAHEPKFDERQQLVNCFK
jgi:hypothetical protein